jgi:hypothetical protein
MAGKHDKAVVAVISNLTNDQMAKISADIMKSKQKNAPYGRGIVTGGLTTGVAALLQKGQRKIGGK